MTPEETTPDSPAVAEASEYLGDLLDAIHGCPLPGFDAMADAASPSVAALLALAERLERERDEAVAKLRDYEDDFEAVMRSECAGDEVHCGCVPHLRRKLAAKDERINDLKAERDEYADSAIRTELAESARDEAREALREILRTVPDLTPPRHQTEAIRRARRIAADALAAQPPAGEERGWEPLSRLERVDP